MAIVLCLLELVGQQPAAMEVDQRPAAYCGGAGGGGDDGDGDDWGQQWKGQWLLKKKKTNNNNKTKNTGDPPKHIGDGLSIFDEEDINWQWLEMEEGAIDHGDWSGVWIPEGALTFPKHLPAGKRFRYILFEGAHCLL